MVGLIIQDPNLKWMIWGGYPYDLGNHHIPLIFPELGSSSELIRDSQSNDSLWMCMAEWAFMGYNGKNYAIVNGDFRNPAPPWMVETPQKSGINHQVVIRILPPTIPSWSWGYPQFSSWKPPEVDTDFLWSSTSHGSTWSFEKFMSWKKTIGTWWSQRWCVFLFKMVFWVVNNHQVLGHIAPHIRTMVVFEVFWVERTTPNTWYHD